MKGYSPVRCAMFYTTQMPSAGGQGIVLRRIAIHSSRSLPATPSHTEDWSLAIVHRKMDVLCSVAVCRVRAINMYRGVLLGGGGSGRYEDKRDAVRFCGDSAITFYGGGGGRFKAACVIYGRATALLCKVSRVGSRDSPRDFPWRDAGHYSRNNHPLPAPPQSPPGGTHALTNYTSTSQNKCPPFSWIPLRSHHSQIYFWQQHGARDWDFIKRAELRYSFVLWLGSSWLLFTVNTQGNGAQNKY